jgi:uncharacterized membrane protein YedE/YeeE
MILISALLIVALLGYLAQTIGLCLVRGIKELKDGNPLFLIAILISGVFAWVCAALAYALDMPVQFKTYTASGWFALGGLLFGLGTAFNQGCGVSTLSKLARGDLKMIATIIGWLAGWAMLSAWQPGIKIGITAEPTNQTYGILAATSVALVIWTLFGDKERKKLWFSMMGIGLLASCLFLYEPQWTPSGLLHGISTAMFEQNSPQWPSIERYLIIVGLLGGMFLAAWRTQRFKFIESKWQQWIAHILAGSLMGIGASLALGGNDSQLLLALPTFSSAGIVTVLAMLLGIWLGLVMRAKMLVINKDLDKAR